MSKSFTKTVKIFLLHSKAFRNNFMDSSAQKRSYFGKTYIYVRGNYRLVNRFLAIKNIPVAPQPPYSPDWNPCDFFLSPKVKNHLKGHHFGTLENIQTAVTDQLKAIPISEFHQCYEEWKKRLQGCVASEGSNFEGDNVEL
ncbi:putative transposase [Trichonephila clavipes]|nr:putative transposase [Trichonephila clavipes]